jgi:KipI family sensor histidine kinase inhibitor
VTPDPPARPAGDAALLVDAAGGGAASLAAAVAAGRLPGVLDIVPGARTVLIVTQPGSWDLTDLARRIRALPTAAEPAGAAEPAEIPVVYDGPDLAEVAALTGLSEAEVIERHQAGEYRVGWLGFSPGFGYLTGLDPALAAVPRLATPRVSVPAGSVAIAGGLAAVYPAASPGGWRLLGRTTARLWDPARQPPALLAPGMRVRFRSAGPGDQAGPADRTSPADRAGPADQGRPAEPASPAHAASQARAARADDFHDPRGFGATGDANPPGSWSGPVEILRPGPLATIQDLGRPGYGHLGVPRSGAADAGSLRLANRLVGNPDDAAGLEFTLGRAALHFHADAVVAVTGATARVTITAADGPNEDDAAGSPGGAGAGRAGAGRAGAGGGDASGARAGAGGADASGARAGAGGADAGRAGGAVAREVTAREVPLDTALAVTAGSVLRLAAPVAGLRSYLAVGGGIDVPEVLGSRSSDLLSGLGPRPLRAGDRLPVGPARVQPVPPASGTAPSGAALPSAPADTPADGMITGGAAGTGIAGGAPSAADAPRDGARPDAVVRLRVLAGPRDDWFDPAALSVLTGEPYRVTPASNRTGLRLAGPALARAGTSPGELPSEGMVTGAIQVPHDGQPILLLADHPVTGGYPVIAVVHSADVDRAAQLRPGQLVRFALAR